MKYIFSFIGMIGIFLTTQGQSKVLIPINSNEKFEKFLKKEKFQKDTILFYPGIANANLKPILSEKINLAANDFKLLSDKKASTEKDYQISIGLSLKRFSVIYLDLDTEDRERICHYFEELMDLVGLVSSNGQLNKFMYGFDPSQK